MFCFTNTSHNRLEHDSSFTRRDVGLGGSEVVDTELVDKVVGHAGEKGYLTLWDLSEARYERIKDTVKNTPGYTLEKKQTDAVWREMGLILQVVGRDVREVRVLLGLSEGDVDDLVVGVKDRWDSYVIPAKWLKVCAGSFCIG